MDIGCGTANKLEQMTVQICYFDYQWHEWNESSAIAESVKKEDAATITLACINNRNYSHYLQERLVALGSARRSLNPETKEGATNQAIAKHVIKAWTNFSLNGKPFACNEKNALFLLEKDTDFRTFVIELSNERSRFVAEVVADQAKN